VPATCVLSTFDTTARFIKVRESWDSYAVKSVKIEWMPRYNVSAPGIANPADAMYKVESVDDWDGLCGMTTDEVITAPGF